MVVWVMLLFVVSGDLKDAKAKINLPNAFKFNNEQSCKENANAMAIQVQTKLGTDNYKVFWDCQPVTEEEYNRALPPKV